MTADMLLKGGMTDEEVYASDQRDTLLDLASEGLLHEHLGRPRRRWSGFADQAHAAKAQWGREYAAFCQAHNIRRVVQVVLRAPASIVPLAELRASHARDSARLGERLRYGRQRFAPSFKMDLVSVHIKPVGRRGDKVDGHFHLVVRASRHDLQAMRRYFEASGWSWWDSVTGGSGELARYPGALSQYITKGLAAAVAAEGGTAFSPENLVELHRQTRYLALSRATGQFRAWRSDLTRHGLVVVEGQDGRPAVRPARRAPTSPRFRRRMLAGTASPQLLRLVEHDFGDGILRPAALVRGSATKFCDLAHAYDIRHAVLAARTALLDNIKGNAPTPESVLRPCGARAHPPPRGDMEGLSAPPW